jgi:hypothetical protein
MASRILRLRRGDACVVCGSALPAGAEAWWDAKARAVTCVLCKEATVEAATADPTPVRPEVSQAGSSAAREHQRCKRQREAHP